MFKVETEHSDFLLLLRDKRSWWSRLIMKHVVASLQSEIDHLTLWEFLRHPHFNHRASSPDYYFYWLKSAVCKKKNLFLGLNPNLSKLIWWSGSRAVPQSQRIIIWTKGKSAFCTNRTFNLSITSISCFNNSVMVKSSDVMSSFFNPRIQSLQLYKTGKLSILKNWNNFLFFQRKKWQWKWLLKRHFWIMKLVEVPLSKKN